jgi:hypothetical protein
VNILAPANFSPCRQYRYTLARDLDPLGMTSGIALWVALNPSTADESNDDPTIRREMNFTRTWGYRWLVKCNAFAIRSTDPKVMLAAEDPIGAENDAWIAAAAAQADIIIAAWGVHGAHRGRHTDLMRMLPADRLHCLGTTKAGMPRHPLYLRGDARPTILAT